MTDIFDLKPKYVSAWDRDKRFAINFGLNDITLFHQGHFANIDSAGRRLKIGRNFMHRLPKLACWFNKVVPQTHMQAANDRRKDYKRDARKYWVIIHNGSIHEKSSLSQAIKFAKAFAVNHPDTSVEVFNRDNSEGVIEFYKGDTYMFFRHNGKPVLTKRQVKQHGIDWQW